MKEAARLSLRKALKKLHEAEIVDVHDAPGAVVHSGYYAMLHAAKAYVLEHSSIEPRKHGAIVGEFGRLLRDRPDDVKEHGRAINRAQTLRNADDYDVEEDIEDVDAVELRADARALFMFVAGELGTTESELDPADDDRDDLDDDSPYSAP